MSKRKAFWGDSGTICRQVEGAIDSELLNMEVSSYGIRFINRVNSKTSRYLPWAELKRLADFDEAAMRQSRASGQSLKEKVDAQYGASFLRILPAEKSQDKPTDPWERLGRPRP